ncbi:MAG: hypothetical protein R6U61_00375 [Thermoplasmata archaeon]
MTAQIDQEIIEAKETIRKWEKNLRRLNWVTDELARQQNKLWGLEDDLEEKKGESVESSADYLVNTIFGDKGESKIDREMEYYEKEMEVESCRSIIDNLEAEFERLKTALVKLKKAEKEYKELIERKKELLKESDPDVAEEIIQYSEKLGEVSADHQEVQEALEAAQNRLNSITSLNQAIYDAQDERVMMLIRSKYSSNGKLTKYLSFIESAKTLVYSMEYNLTDFINEFSDLEYIVNEDLDKESIQADYAHISKCLEGKLMVHLRMGNALESSGELYKEVNEIKVELEQRAQELQRLQDSIKKQFDEFVEDA